MSSRRFLLRRVWHLAIPTPLAMGYSPTEYAEFTEPPAEMSSHGFLLRRVWHLAIPTPPAMGYSPTEYAEFTEPPTEMSSHGFHRFTQMLGCAVLPRNSQNSQNLAAWVWQGCHTLLICAHPCHLWESFLCKRFCVFGAFRGSFFTACSVGAAETAAPPGGIHGSSVQISPPHHLTTTTSFHLEPSLLHVLPVLWVRLRHHLRLVDAQPGEHDCSRCERHRHAVVVVGVDRL